jgi:hypothetical protein
LDSLVCDPSAPVAATDTRRLSKIEYENVLRDLLGATVYGAIDPLVQLFPNEEASVSVALFENRFSENRLAQAMEIALKAADAVTEADAPVNQWIAGHSSCSTHLAFSDECARQLIARFGLKVHRRPLSSAESQWYFSIYQTGTGTQDRLHLLLMTMLQSPEMLYHFELGDLAGESLTNFDVSLYELASRLSFGLWDTMPDASLYAKAQNGSLADPAVLQSTIDSMLQDGRARAKLSRFFDYWLQTTRLNRPEDGNVAFLAGVDPNGLGDEMVRELREYIDHIVWTRKGSYQDLMTSNVSFARTSALAAIYGHPLSSDPGSGTQLNGGTRRGLLLKAALLSSGDDKTHPIIRGATLRKQILCEKLSPPGDISTSAAPGDWDSLDAIRRMTTRQRTAGKTSPPACASCHSKINPLGFALEEYDGLGRARGQEANYAGDGSVISTHPLDLFVDRIRLDGSTLSEVRSAAELVELIGKSEKALSCAAKQAFRFYQVRLESQYDGCVVRDSSNAMRGSFLDGVIRGMAGPYARRKIVKP